MIDKLHLKTKQIVQIDNLELKNCGPNICRYPDSQYRNCIVVKNASKHILTIKTNPVFSNIDPTQIQVNPSNWNSFHELQEALKSISDINELKIMRIDHAVDISIPIETVFHCMRVKYKQDCNIHNENAYKKGLVSGFYIGSKSSDELFNIYDKGYELQKGQKLVRNKLHPLGEVTRIETKCKKRKIQFPMFRDLPRYQEENPYKNVEWHQIKGDNKFNERQEAFETLLKSDGLCNLYNNLNQQNNFKRNFGKLLKENNFSDDLQLIYQSNLGQFFGDGYGK